MIIVLIIIIIFPSLPLYLQALRERERGGWRFGIK